jgi:hypothetical protein
VHARTHRRWWSARCANFSRGEEWEGGEGRRAMARIEACDVASRILRPCGKPLGRRLLGMEVWVRRRYARRGG